MIGECRRGSTNCLANPYGQRARFFLLDDDGFFSTVCTPSRSTRTRSRSMARSQPAEISSRNARAWSTPAASSEYRTSRPCLSCVTRPASSSTCRCFTIAWRVTLAPSASAVAERAPWVSLLTSESRVGSPRAEKTAAAADLPGGAFDMSLEVLRLPGPAAFVHAERARPSVFRHLVEARLDDREQRTLGDRLEAELDQRGRFVLGICVGV